MTTEKCANPATQLEIDEAILDYLLYTAIGAVLEDSGARRACEGVFVRPDRADLPLQMVDAFLVIFNANHPRSLVSPTLQFRTRLLQFTVLFTRRSTIRISILPATTMTTPATRTNVTLTVLQDWRARHRARSQAYLSHRSDAQEIFTGMLLRDQPPMTEPVTDCNRGSAFASSSSRTSPDLDAKPAQVSLLDTLPAFMALSAFQNSMHESNITVLWMDLAARFMAQATLEQYVDFGANGPEVLQAAFAWGFDANSTAEEGSDDWEVNSMFSGEKGEVPEWAGVRKQYIGMLLSPDGMPLHVHFQTLLDCYLFPGSFENLMAQFLDRSLHHQPEPLLAQLEKGHVEGLSGEQTQALKHGVGFR